MKKESHWIRNIIVGIVGIVVVTFIWMVAPDYTRNDITDRINLIINNNNVTSSLKRDVFVDGKGVIYLSEQDIANFFDYYIEYDEDYNQMITTSDTKVATLPLGKKQMTVNGSLEDILGSLVEKDDTYYLPFSDMNDVYNVEIEYIKESNRVVVTSLDRKLEKADAAKNLNVKWKAKSLSRTLEEIEKGQKVVVVSNEENGWSKIRTSLGTVGYVKTKDLANNIVVRDEMKNSTRLDGKVSLVWDYYSQYVTAPDRTGESIPGINVVSPSFFMLERLGKGDITDNADEDGKRYVEWAKGQGYEVWPIFSNDSMPETTHEILSDYNLRAQTIENILALAIEYQVDGINLDFENMYEADKDLYTRFVIELYPRLREYGMNLSVDVTAPDGSPMWSLCFDRYHISRNCDYLIFMAYDQNNGNKAGSNAAYDWVSVNLDKFLRDIDSEKIILGIPLYTRTWELGSEEDVPYVVDLNDIADVLPADATITWNEDAKQNIAEYTKNGNNFIMWIEDEQSIEAKLDLMLEKQLAGVAFWEKDRETENIWHLLEEKMSR